MENEQAKKNFLIKVGVISSATLIFIFWFLNFKNVFIFNSAQETEEGNSLNSLTQEFKEAFDQINSGLEINSVINNEESPSSSNGLSPTIIEATKKGLPIENGDSPVFSGDGIENSASSSEQASEMAPRLYIEGDERPSQAIPNNSSACPAYINCMPTIGEAPLCNIPPGCEGITQFVY